MNDSKDKRSELRLPDKVAVFFELDPSPEPESPAQVSITSTQDISANGLQVTCDNELPLNSIHQLCIEIPSRRFYLVGEVAWLSPVGEEYAIGISLIESEYTDIGFWKEYICGRFEP